MAKDAAKKRRCDYRYRHDCLLVGLEIKMAPLLPGALYASPAAETVDVIAILEAGLFQSSHVSVAGRPGADVAIRAGVSVRTSQCLPWPAAYGLPALQR